MRKSKKPSGHFWRKWKLLKRRYKADLNYRKRIISVHWQIEAGADDLREFAKKYGLKIETKL